MTLRAGRDEACVLMAGLDGGLLPVSESVGLPGLAVDFESPGADFPEVDVVLLEADMGLTCPSADLLVAEASFLGPCAALGGSPVALVVLLAMVEVGGLLGPGTGPELNEDADKYDWA